MQLKITKIKDTLSPDLHRLYKKSQDKKPFHEAMGLAVESIAKRSFNQASLRIKPWPNLASGKAARLRKSGTLAKSVRSVVTEQGVAIGSDRKYAAIHQLGGKTKPHIIRPKHGKALAIPGLGFFAKVNHPGSKIPARPFIPIGKNGPSPEAKKRINEAVRAEMGI